MKYLLDTHTFIWWDSNQARLSAAALALCADKSNILWLSLVSIWELQIKIQLNKLSCRLPLADLITDQQQTNDIELLPIETTHIFALDTLPLHHKDPFDRLLIAQAQVEGATLISNDPWFDNYAIPRVW